MGEHTRRKLSLPPHPHQLSCSFMADPNVFEANRHAAEDSSSHSTEISTTANDPQALLKHALYPEDIYTTFDGRPTYWADLPSYQKRKFINSQSNTEAWSEFLAVGRLFKLDPLLPFTTYCRKYVIYGMGLFVEGYVLFSIGNLKPLFQAVWPTCWKTHEECSANWLDAITYLEILGIICGQVMVGFLGDGMSRKWGLVQDATIMTIGCALLTGVWGVTLNGWVIAYAWSLFIYSIGVGGEYPMTSTTALESRGHGPLASRDDRMHRGRNV